MRASPSGLARLEACPGSDLLPQFGSTSPAAVAGIQIHAFISMIGRGIGEDVAILSVDEEWRDSLIGVDFGGLKIDPESGVSELAIAWNIATGEVREISRGGIKTRDEIRSMALDDEMVGVFDWVALSGDSAVVVVDFKTGYSAVDKAMVNLQVGAGAVMAAKLFGRDRAEVAISYVHDSGIWNDVATLDSMDLDSMETRIRVLINGLNENKVVYRETGLLPKLDEGQHCRFCPARKACPAKVALVQSLISTKGETPDMFSRMPVPLTPEAAAELWPKLTLATAAIEEIKSSIRDLAATEPIKLSNGKVLALVEKTKSTIIPSVAKKILNTEIFEECVNREETISKKSISDALRKRLQPNEKLSRLEKQFYGELESMGGLKPSSWRSVEEVSPDSKRIAATSEEKK